MSRFNLLVLVSIFLGGCAHMNNNVDPDRTVSLRVNSSANGVSQTLMTYGQYKQMDANAELTKQCAADLPNCHLYGLYPTNWDNLQEQREVQMIQAIYNLQGAAFENQAFVQKAVEDEARIKKAEAETEAARESARILMEAKRKESSGAP